jgi:protein-S-isoprenylcysteine O-methyltransferase Ste14
LTAGALTSPSVAIALLVWRTKIEDAMLQRDLPGYAAYTARARYRLIPGIWRNRAIVPLAH